MEVQDSHNRRWDGMMEAFASCRQTTSVADSHGNDHLLYEIAIKSGFYYFQSVPGNDKRGWKVRLAKTMQASDQTLLRFHVTDNEGRPLSGCLTFAEVKVEIKDGLGFLPVGAFVKQSRIISFCRNDDDTDVPGEMSPVN